MTNDRFRVALSASFRNPDGSMAYPSFDLSPLRDATGVALDFLPSGDPV